MSFWDLLSLAKLSGNQEVKGTGQTVDELRKRGYSDKDLSALGAKKSPSTLQSGLAEGITQGFRNLDEEKAAIAHSGRPVYSDVENPTLPPDYFAPSDPSDYLAWARARFTSDARRLFFGR